MTEVIIGMASIIVFLATPCYRYIGENNEHDY